MRHKIQYDVASKEEIAVVRKLYPEASILGCVLVTAVLALLVSIYLFVRTTSIHGQRDIFLNTADLCATVIVIIFMHHIILFVHAAVCMHKEHIQICNCTVLKANANKNSCVVACVQEDATHVMRVWATTEVCSKVSDDIDDLPCRVAFVGLLRPCLIISDKRGDCI